MASGAAGWQAACSGEFHRHLVYKRRAAVNYAVRPWPPRGPQVAKDRSYCVAPGARPAPVRCVACGVRSISPLAVRRWACVPSAIRSSTNRKNASSMSWNPSTRAGPKHRTVSHTAQATTAQNDRRMLQPHGRGCRGDLPPWDAETIPMATHSGAYGTTTTHHVTSTGPAVLGTPRPGRSERAFSCFSCFFGFREVAANQSPRVCRIGSHLRNRKRTCTGSCKTVIKNVFVTHCR